MLTTVKTRKIVDGKCLREILGWDHVAKFFTLPDEYTMGYPSYLDFTDSDGNKVLRIWKSAKERIDLRVGDKISEYVYESIIQTMREAGERLVSINQERLVNRMLSSFWNGTETVEI